MVDVLSTALRNRAGRVQAKAIDEMLAKAIHEPEFAAALLRKHNLADQAAMKLAFLGKFGVRVPTVANRLVGDDSDEADPFAQMVDAARIMPKSQVGSGLAPVCSEVSVLIASTDLMR